MMSSWVRGRLDAWGARPLYLLIAATSIALIFAALFMQHVVGLNPCPLCIIQRVIFFLLALIDFIELFVGCTNRYFAFFQSVSRIFVCLLRTVQFFFE